MLQRLGLAVVAALSTGPVLGAQALQVPLLVEIEQARRGNPLAAYAALVDLEDRYRAAPQFTGIYVEVRLMAEEFLGVPDAGVRAMSTVPQLRQAFPPGETPIPAAYTAQGALRVIEKRAAQTQVVIWGEEHHLPQTRSLYEPMLRLLWKQGYRYLAAETFSDSVTATRSRFPTFAWGVYSRDPVYASAVRVAIDLGYRLIAYEEQGRAPNGDGSFRDRRQAENLQSRVFARDPQAKVLVLAGRGHASEVTAPDGWTPMASVLKRLTGIDPFTVFSVRMGERMTPEEEDPRYRYATAKGLVTEPTIFVDSAGGTLGDDSFDALVFWPRVRMVDGRPDWLKNVLGRRSVALPAAFVKGSGLRLVQAFRAGEPATAIPVDQFLLDDMHQSRNLFLSPGTYWSRTIDRTGAVIAEARLTVR